MMTNNFIADEVFENINGNLKNIPLANYEACVFRNCSFNENNFSGYQFIECYFEDCDFSMCNVTDTVFREVEFSTCKLVGLQFNTCNQLLIDFKFSGCILDYASFYEMTIPKTIFKNCSLIEADFTQARRKEANFMEADLSGAIFDGCDLQKSNFQYAINYIIDPELNNIKDASFTLNGIEGLLTKYRIKIEK